MNPAALRDEIAELEQVRDELKRNAADAATEFHQRRQRNEKLEAELATARSALDAVVAERDKALKTIEAEVAAARQAEEQGLEQAKQVLAAERRQADDAHRRELARLAQELAAKRQAKLEEERRLVNQFERLREEVRSKADMLRGLELIEQSQYDELLGVTGAGAAAGDQHSDWPEVLDFPDLQAGVVPHIQRYLFAQGIIYPYSLLCNFYALLLTGDLIVLAGLSGAGKTMLVKAFADATGNCAHIIPVKPNWTSAEDLTGYYNPLQQSYLTTPFLDALIAARRDPGRLHLICLDEMNLARVEYYFADFLSALEARDKQSVIYLYADDEAGHVRAEVKLFVDLLLDLRGDKPLIGLGDFLRDSEIARQLRERLGIDDGEPLLKLHARLRRMLSGVLNVPSRLEIPPNVRFIGTVNMDATTNYLSPKVLDRAHVLQFQSPLAYWDHVSRQLRNQEGPSPKTGVKITAGEFPRRSYPEFDPSDETDTLARTLNDWRHRFLDPMGIDLGIRVMRQSLAFRDALRVVYPSTRSQTDIDHYALNLVVRQKVLPRFSFDEKQPARNGNNSIEELVDAFASELREKARAGSRLNAGDELRALIARARANDGIYNYWS